jgi:serine/threonine protein kinase HipA of HipAB toxin-antitoxin module
VLYLHPDEAQGFLSEVVQINCRAITSDPWEAHTHRFPVGDGEGYERTNMTDFVLLYVKWRMRLMVLHPPFLQRGTVDRSRALEAGAGLELPW